MNPEDGATPRELGFRALQKITWGFGEPSPREALTDLRQRGYPPADVKRLGLSVPEAVAAASLFPHQIHTQETRARRFKAPVVAPLESPLTDWAWYWAGVLSIDGSVHGRTASKFSLAMRRSDGPYLTNLTIGLRTDYQVRRDRSGCATLLMASSDLASAVSRFGLAPRRGHRHGGLPIHLLHNPHWVAGPMLSYVRGVMDSTIYFTSKTIAFSHPSRELLQQLREFLQLQDIGCKEIQPARSKFTIETARPRGPNNLRRLAELMYGEPSPSGPSVWRPENRVRFIEFLFRRGIRPHCDLRLSMPLATTAAETPLTSFGKPFDPQTLTYRPETSGPAL